MSPHELFSAQMKKEVFLAIAIGFALGLVITFGIWTANKSLKNLPKPTPSPTVAAQSEGNPSPTPSNQVTNNQLTITSPEDESLVSSPKITVKGTTSPSAIVTISWEDDQTIVTADANGAFSTNIELVGGYNTIKVTSFDKIGTPSEQTLTVTYSTAKI